MTAPKTDGRSRVRREKKKEKRFFKYSTDCRQQGLSPVKTTFTKCLVHTGGVCGLVQYPFTRTSEQLPQFRNSFVSAVRLRLVSSTHSIVWLSVPNRAKGRVQGLSAESLGPSGHRSKESGERMDSRPTPVQIAGFTERPIPTTRRSFHGRAIRLHVGSRPSHTDDIDPSLCIHSSNKPPKGAHHRPTTAPPPPVRACRVSPRPPPKRKKKVSICRE